MVCFVYDDHIEVSLGESFQALFALHRLHAANGHAVESAQGDAFRLLPGAAKPRKAPKLFRRLIEQLAPMGQDENPISLQHAVFGDFGEHGSLSRACRKDQ